MYLYYLAVTPIRVRFLGGGDPSTKTNRLAFHSFSSFAKPKWANTGNYFTLLSPQAFWYFSLFRSKPFETICLLYSNHFFCIESLVFFLPSRLLCFSVFLTSVFNTANPVVCLQSCVYSLVRCSNGQCVAIWNPSCCRGLRENSSSKLVGLLF